MLQKLKCNQYCVLHTILLTSMHPTLICVLDLVANSSWIIIANQTSMIIKHSKLSLRPLVPVGSHPLQLADNVEILRITIIQMEVDVISATMELLHSQGTLVRPAIEWQPNVNPL